MVTPIFLAQYQMTKVRQVLNLVSTTVLPDGTSKSEVRFREVPL